MHFTVIRAFLALVCIHTIKFANSLDNGLALTPPMGWMTWQRFRCVVDCEAYPDDCISEWNIKKQADLMVQDGYLEAGYEYIVVDDCWMDKERDEKGKLRGDPIRFPSGMKALGDYFHSLGLKYGIYEDYGTKTCSGYPGSLGHLETDAKTFAEWGVDYIKLDACYTDKDKLEEGYIEFGNYLNKTGRPIVYSCSWPAYQEPLGIESNYSTLADHCNLWRNWDDIEDTWYNVTNILKWFSDNQERIAPFHGPGHWNDPDMLLIGNFALSYEQAKAQMAIWSVFAAPLLMSVDLRTIDPKFKEILQNKEIIAINQDKLGVQGKLIKTVNKIDIWLKPILPTIDNSPSYAIAFLSNRIDGYPYKIDVPLDDLGLLNPDGYSVTDIYNPKNNKDCIPQAGNFTVRVVPSGVVLLKAIPTQKCKCQFVGNIENNNISTSC